MATDKPLGEEVLEYMHAGFPGLWVHSYEHEEAIREIAEHSLEDYGMFFTWDAIDGIHRVIGTSASGLQWEQAHDATSPVGAFNWFAACNVEPGLAEPHRCCIILKNLHNFLNGQVLQLVQNYLVKAKRSLRQRVVVLSTQSEIHKDLEKCFQLITHKLPDETQLKSILRSTASGDGDLPEDKGEVDAIVKAACGLTRTEAEDTFSLCLVRSDQVTSRPVFEMKAKALKKSGLGLELLRGSEKFDDIGGLANLKDFTREMLENRSENPLLWPKGIILAGVPGTGKSLFAKALGNTLQPQRPTIRWDIGSVMSKWVGESQHNMRRCLDTVDAMSPCNLFADEFEKQIATGTSGSTAGGDIQTQMLGQWLTWHQEHETDVYVILTMNNIMAIAKTMPELLARFDEVFFLDYPAKLQRQEIWKIHLQKYGHIEHADEFDPGKLPDDENWTGRDIEKCCRQAAQRRKPLESIKIGTLSSQVRESIAELREFATGRWMSVEYDDYYDKDQHQKRAANVAMSNGHARDTVRKKRRRKSAT